MCWEKWKSVIPRYDKKGFYLKPGQEKKFSFFVALWYSTSNSVWSCVWFIYSKHLHSNTALLFAVWQFLGSSSEFDWSCLNNNGPPAASKKHWMSFFLFRTTSHSTYHLCNPAFSREFHISFGHAAAMQWRLWYIYAAAVGTDFVYVAPCVYRCFIVLWN